MYYVPVLWYMVKRPYSFRDSRVITDRFVGVPYGNRTRVAAVKEKRFAI